MLRDISFLYGSSTWQTDINHNNNFILSICLFVYSKIVSVHSPGSLETQYIEQAIDKTETTSVSKVLD